jgi:hypothetical protein
MDLLAILGGEFSEFYSHRLAFLCDSARIREILDIIWEEKKSRPAMEQDGGVDHICKLVNNEMESAKPLLKMKLKDVSPEYVEQWHTIEGEITSLINKSSQSLPALPKCTFLFEVFCFFESVGDVRGLHFRS